MPGLMRYLYGPGKANEHTDQHAVAAATDLEYAYAGALSGSEAGEFGRLLEAAWHEQVAVMPLTEIPQCCSSKFPTLWLGEVSSLLRPRGCR